MQTTIQVKTPPEGEPISRDLAKQHCRIFHDSDDALIDGYITAARSVTESYLGRALLTQTLTWTMQTEHALRPLDWHYLDRRAIAFPRSPVQSINTVTVLDALGNLTVIPPATLPIPQPRLLTGYVADLTRLPASIRFGMETILSDGRRLCSANLEHVQVEFVAGQTDEDAIPQPIINSILLTTAYLYEHRGDAQVDMPSAAQWLLSAYRLNWV